MKKLERDPSNRVLFGICGGFARYFGVDADFVRILWIFSLLFGGIGLVPYVAAIFLVVSVIFLATDPWVEPRMFALAAVSLAVLVGMIMIMVFVKPD